MKLSAAFGTDIVLGDGVPPSTVYRTLLSEEIKPVALTCPLRGLA